MLQTKREETVQLLLSFILRLAEFSQRYTYRVLQTIQMKLILLCVWAERAVSGSDKTALKFKYEIHRYNLVFGAVYKLEK